jgi:Icc-related predicted phosphoesterase
MNKQPKEERLRILAAGDLHGNSDIAERLAEKAKDNNVDLVVLVGDIHGASSKTKNLIAPFKKVHKKVVFVPGNWDSPVEAETLKNMYNIKNIEGYYVSYKNVGIVGIGNSSFWEDGEKKILDSVKRNFDKMQKLKDLRKSVVVSHMHAEGTRAEFSGFKGSKTLRKTIKYFQPDLFLQAHIHEAEGIEEKIGKTRVINVGRRGTVIDI